MTLRSLRPMGRALPPLLARGETRDARRNAEAPWRAWYGTAAWKRLRMQVLTEALWVCEQTGVPLVPGRDAPNAAVVDHIRPHRGDRALFFDRANLQAVSKEWHDGVKQGLDLAGWKR